MSSSINTKEIENFARDSAHWWDERGPFGILHRLNPVRMEYILSQTGDVKGQKILDVGCGGGLVCEPLARLGAKVTGLDADTQAIEAAQEHADEGGLKITYKCGAVEDHKGQYDAVMALEILEHVNEPAEFLKNCASLLKPGGFLIASTLNRTPKSFVLGIVAAEYIMGYVPRGTHNWKKFIKPSELSRWGRGCGLSPADVTGLALNPLNGEFELSSGRLDVNYFMSFKKEVKS
ncbi:bifunctional 2-polyprenyl-6-hydroxyphenol methylase/3-demethylubiquinol 3-O-methyltransferase UbiG [Alphaproteobacteria bacterium]|nr:bifunctional 2-polyprenyl-6-hydroxyphenol methylase/3-demethylubiquinol 3-O-methyltransferase UbiG [Alphaproteobacteria bacterium]